MTGKLSGIKRGGLARSIGVSLAGVRVGGAFAIDGVLQKLKPGENKTPSAFARREARHFVAELGRLKGTYVKIGQMFALLGEHFLPPVLTEALHELESQTQALSWEEIKPALQCALGDRLTELKVERTALAAASLAQVHRATIISSGEEICLKIQYPGLADVIDTDFDAVVRMLLLARWVKAGRDLDDWLESMRIQLHHEIDYVREAQMTDRMAVNIVQCDAAASRSNATYHVPARYPRYCAHNVLALEYIDGYVVSRSEVAQLSQSRRNALGKSMLELFFLELYRWGLLQTDPNFGNYLIRLDDSTAKTDELVLLDFGSMLECDKGFLIHLGNAIIAGQGNDRALLLESLVGLGCLNDTSGKEASESFSQFCIDLLEPLRAPQNLPAKYLNDKGEYCWGTSQLLRRAGRNAANSAASLQFAVPSREFAMIARKLTGVFTFISVLNAEFNAHDMVKDHIAKWLEDE
ncbi:MAG: putative unusual protein kinase regulating ubiquinone biosynthesis (AarF/ABC1/UbiB family) [Halioglobus sp.]|jgi:predicted unusual protein kinase regulating ubiquinone biosynthesis (AarF/ABC1/UbiB family)